MRKLTEKELYRLQLAISEELFGHAARICAKRQQILDAAVRGAIKALQVQGIASYDWPKATNA